MSRPARALPVLAGLLLSLAACAGADTPRRATFPEYELPARPVAAPESTSQRTGRGTLVLDGGGYVARAALDRIVVEAGADPTLCLIDAASDGRGDSRRLFRDYPRVRLRPIDLDGADSTAILDALRSCSGYYFGGGNPERLSEALRPDGRESRALAVIRERYEKHGAVVSGSSAGAMIVGPITLCECGGRSSLAALLRGQLFQAPGFDFLEHILIDAHFLARGLLGRHVYALARNGIPIGIGIDEQTAVVVPGDGGPWEVIGRRAVAVIETPPTATTADLSDFTLSLLSPGDRFDPIRRRFAPAPKRQPVDSSRDADAAPISTGDVFAANRIAALAVHLVETPATEAVGTAARRAVRVTIRETEETEAYSDGATYSITGLSVNIER